LELLSWGVGAEGSVASWVEVEEDDDEDEGGVGAGGAAGAGACAHDITHRAAPAIQTPRQFLTIPP